MRLRVDRLDWRSGIGLLGLAATAVYVAAYLLALLMALFPTDSSGLEFVGALVLSVPWSLLVFFGGEALGILDPPISRAFGLTVTSLGVLVNAWILGRLSAALVWPRRRGPR